MPRWLLASVLALLLSCLGVGAAAQNQESHDAQGCSSQALAAASGEAAGADAMDASSAAGEAAADPVLEAIDHDHEPFVPALFSAPAPRPALMSLVSSWLSREHRPPRAGAFLA